MAPSRKEQYEKNAWSWVENCSPLEVTDEHIRTAYRVNFSRCKVGACRYVSMHIFHLDFNAK